MCLCVTGGNITDAFQGAQWTFFFFFLLISPPGISQCSCNSQKSTGSARYTYNEKVKSILQATAPDVYKTSIWKHTKIKLHRYIIYMQWRARKINKDKILMQKHTPRETTNATNVHHQQYSSYSDTPNMNTKHKNQNHFYFR